MVKSFTSIILLFFLATACLAQGLSNITDVLLIFTPAQGGSPPIAAFADDLDGDGPEPFTINGPINLLEGTDYIMAIDIQNSLEGIDQSLVIANDRENYLFFFQFSEQIFNSPTGNGNIDNRADPINYVDSDINGLPLGIITNWQSACGTETTPGTIQIRLQYQPGIKSETSTSTEGVTEFDIIWPVQILENPDAPPCENEEEVITDITLTFTPTSAGEVVTVSAQDPDGIGPLPITTNDILELTNNTEYTLDIEFANSIEGEDITAEVREEGVDHQIFFEWTEGIFAVPMGNGNIDNRADPVIYLDEDENMLPIGLSSRWTTSNLVENGTFRIKLQHQPGIKSATSTAEDGSTDIDFTWNVGVVVSTNEIPVNTTTLKLWPNPVQEQLNWRLEEQRPNNTTINIYNANGQLVLQENGSMHRDNQQLVVNMLPSGAYWVKVSGEGKTWTSRFIKL